MTNEIIKNYTFVSIQNHREKQVLMTFLDYTNKEFIYMKFYKRDLPKMVNEIYKYIPKKLCEEVKNHE